MVSLRFPEPELVNASNELARPDMGTDIDASEYRDAGEVLAAKIDVLAQMIQASERCCAYTGAGLSTSAGIGDYASKAKGSAVKRWDPKADDGPHMEWLKEMRPTRGHRVLAGLERAGYLKEWINQNHDGLAMKATFPLDKLNEIHGSWFDGRNPVVAMGGSMRRDLTRRLEAWSESADLVLALGTSLSGLYADCVAENAAARWREERTSRGAVRADVEGGTAPASTGAGETRQASADATAASVGGLVIVSLTKTPLDGDAALRIYATLDEVLGRLAEKLGLERRGMLPTDAEVTSASKRSALWRAYAVWYRDVHDPKHKRETPAQILRRAQPTNR